MKARFGKRIIILILTLFICSACRIGVYEPILNYEFKKKQLKLERELKEKQFELEK